jgi:hypothetical protein
MRWLLVLTCGAVGFVAGQAPPTGQQIMRNVNERAMGGDSEMHLRLQFRDFRRGDHIREVEVRRKKLPSGYRSLYRMTAPEHVAGISLLLAEDIEMPGMWMYLPNADHLLPVVTRGLSALASDFSCEDLRLSFPLSDYHFNNLGTEVLDGRTYYRVEMRPGTERLESELGFTKATGWVLDALWIVARVQYFDQQGQVFKTFHADYPEQVQGVWTVRHYTMTNDRAQHATDAEVVDVRYHLQFPAADFEPHALKAAARKTK